VPAPGTGWQRRDRAPRASVVECHAARTGAGQHAGDGAGGIGVAAAIDDVDQAVLEAADFDQRPCNTACMVSTTQPLGFSRRGRSRKANSGCSATSGWMRWR
jgi:hypothetical protein